MKYTLTKRDIGILLGFFGIVILGLTYYFVYMGYSGKTEELRTANAGLQSRVDVLQSIADQQDQLIADTRSYNEKSDKIFEQYPAGFRDEDGFMLAVDLQAISPFESVSSVTNTDPIALYSFEDIRAKTDEQVRGYIPDQNAAAAPADGEEAPTEGEQQPSAPAPEPSEPLPGLECKDTTINCTCDYPSFKNAVAYLIDKNEKHSIQIQAVYDITSGIIASAYTIRSPYVINTDKVYTEPEVPFIVQGTDNIFGTISLHDSRKVTYATTRAAEAEAEMTESASGAAEASE
ncbi:MAG: hypothetical protein IKP31_02095 [Lachnospiraceae bacterium]|nr:hypothetical protein [Lachnospiraceae bacterium]